MKLLYNIVIWIATQLARIAALFNPGAALWVAGQKGWKGRLRQVVGSDERWIWMHCASLGEFEQGRPVIEAIREKSPELKILLTFFSPSGYEVRKNYKGADHVCYLPADTPANAELFVKTVNPALVIFVKYEFWNNFMGAIHKRSTPFYLISAIFRPGQHFFRWYGSFFRSMLGKFTTIFVQDERSVQLLAGIGVNNAVVAGDTRFDRVLQIAGAAVSIEKLESFASGEWVFLAGSSWRPDEEIIAEYIRKKPGTMKWIFAPHEIGAENIRRLEDLIGTSAIKFSAYDGGPTDARVMIIDNIGMLSSAYRYAWVAAVGGGFGKGIHNILEPACWGIPVLFGPNHNNFREAVEMKIEGGAFAFGNYMEFERIVDSLTGDSESYNKAARIAGDFVKKNSGATAKILHKIYSEDINNRV